MIPVASGRAVGGASPPAGARRLITGLAAWFAAVVVLSSLVGPPLIIAFDAIVPGIPPQRVFRRVTMLVALVLLAIWARQLRVRRAADFGLGRGSGRGGAFGRAFLAGCAAVAVLLTIEVAAGYRHFAFELTLETVLLALAAAPLIGLVEEAICRGLLLFPFAGMRGRGLAAAAAAVSFVYSTAHFARGGRALEIPMDWRFGWAVWGLVPQVVLANWEAWIGLFVFGLLLYRMAALQGHAWGVAGLHGGAVLALQLGGGISEPAAAGESLFFTSGQLPDLPLAALLVVALFSIGARRTLTTSSRVPFRSSTAR